MTDQAQTKICKMCFMSIPAEARKCPHCQHFQNRVSMFMFHPAFGIIFAIIPMFILLTFYSKMFDRGEDYQKYSGQIEITESKIVFGEYRREPTVDVIGTITNKSPVPWKDIRFQVDFQNGGGQRVDTGQTENRIYMLPAGDALSFKVSYRREFAETNYVTHTIRVVSAKDNRSRW